MILYDDYEPKKITLHAISDNGKQISLDAFITPDEKHLLPISYSEESTKHQARIAYSTHRRCTACNEIFPKEELLYGNPVCRSCRDANEYKKYLTIPLVELEFPIYINDDFIIDEDALNCYILDRELVSEEGLEIYNTKRVPFNIDLIDWLDDVTCDMGYEESLRDLLSVKEYEELVNLQMKVNNFMCDKVYPLYEADTKARCSIKEYLFGSVYATEHLDK